MSYYIGIDLGTTNSAICSYDGQNVRIWQSTASNADTTPSAIYIDRRGNRYYGQRAYDTAPRDPSNSATLFKRFMGTSNKMEFMSAGITMTPEECSAEILKVLYGYLPEEIRSDPETAVVITVPAAFNQMKKDATMEAARLAGFNKVALMQEPVAAVMSVMRHSNQEGIFLVYDLGGGTFDISIAENISGKVNLLSHGGVEMCGGRDWDRHLVNKLVIPWLRDQYNLPDDLLVNPKFKTLISMCHWAAEKAKIELSSRDDAVISLNESEAHAMDLDGEEIYVDVPISREMLNGLIADQVKETVEATKNTMSKAGLTANDIERIVFVGGPTNYKRLRDLVCEALALPADINVNPMTAVAEGASIFAESIDWSDASHGRKATNAELSTEIDLNFRYNARTPESSASFVFLTKNASGLTAEISSLDTGWVSGRIQVEDKKSVRLPLPNQGENRFAIKVYTSNGQSVSIPESQFVITRTVATIGAIPASHSIGVEVLSSLGGPTVLEYLVRAGDDLPKKGTTTFRAAQVLKAGSHDSLNFKLWEGDIKSPVDANQGIGVAKIIGTDFDTGVIPTGAEIICEYEMGDSGALNLVLSVPSIGATFKTRNFYSRQEGQEDTLDTDRITEEGEDVLSSIREIQSKVQDDRLEQAKKKAENAAAIGSKYCGTEEIMQASNDVLEAKKLMNEVKEANLPLIRQSELDNCLKFFNDQVRKYAKPNEEKAFDAQAETAQRAIDRNAVEFNNILDQMWQNCVNILWREDWYVIQRFYQLVKRGSRCFRDEEKFYNLKAQGEKYIREDNIDDLRNVMYTLWDLQVHKISSDDMHEKANIVRG